MSAPIKALVNMLQASQPSRIDRLLARSKAGTAAVMAEVEKINAEWRALPEEEKQRHRAYWRHSNMGDFEEYEGEARHNYMDDRGFNKR